MKRLIVFLFLVNICVLLLKCGNYNIQTNVVYITNYIAPKEVLISSNKHADSYKNVNAITSEVLSEVPSEVLQEVPSEVLQEVPSEVLSEVPSEVLSEVPSKVLQEVPSEVLPEVPNEVLPEVPNEILVDMPSLDNDIDERVAKILLSFQKMNFTDSVYSYM
jgi:hypothetical protein